MPDPSVGLSLRTDGAGPEARARVMRNVVAIAVRPTFTPADLATVKLVPTTPRPAPGREHVVRRAEPTSGRNTIRSRFLAEATRELYERLGEFERRVVNGSVVLRWDLGGDGDGIVVARKSTEEARNGETIGAQLNAMLRYCDAAGHKPRIVVAVLNLSGRSHFDDRHDFAEVFEAFHRGEASWAVYRGMDRLARSMTWTALFVHYLREYGIGLHIAQLHKQVDLHNPYEVAQLWVLGMTAELEAASSGERMLTALSAQMRDAGKGWSKSGGLGFTRDDENFIVVDEEEWPLIILIHELYASARSVAVVQRTLELKHQLRLAQGTVHRILRDERYVTGEIKTKDPSSEGGFRVDVVHLPRPIPRALWESNQMLLDAKRGKATKTPEAQFVTRGLPVYHARCMDADDPSRSVHRLRSVRTKTGNYRFVHGSVNKRRTGYRTPDCCRGWSLAVEIVERAVIRGVRTMLEDNDALHRAIALGRTNEEPTADRGLFTADDRLRLDREIRRLERYREGLWERHLDRIRAGRRLNGDRLEEELQMVDAELSGIRRQLVVDTQLRRRPTSSTPIPAHIEEVLTEEPPHDPELRLRRWAIVNELVTQVIVYDTDDGISVELYGPLVPDSDDAGTWDPIRACASDTGTTPVRPDVPQPFRTPAIPERLVPAYRWRMDPCGFASEDLTCERIIAALRVVSAEHPTGPIFGHHGVGLARWRSIAERRGLPASPDSVYKVALAGGTTSAGLVRDAVGARAAVVLGRALVESREDAVWVLEAALRDGFVFGQGWRDRANTFAAQKPYRFCAATIYSWANRFAGGDLAGLIADAEAIVAHGPSSE